MSGKKFPGDASVTNNYEVKVAKPMDSRSVVRSLLDLTNPNTWKVGGLSFAYEGMVTVVLETSSLYVLASINGDVLTWVKQSSSSSSSEKFAGVFLTIEQLNQSVGGMGYYAFLDSGPGIDTLLYVWDINDNKWVLSGGSGGVETPESIKTKLLANPDTFVLNKSQYDNVNNIAEGALKPTAALRNPQPLVINLPGSVPVSYNGESRKEITISSEGGGSLASYSETYALTTGETPPEADSSAWSMNAQLPNATYRYAWAKVVLTYSDGSPSTTYIRNTSIYGETGPPGPAGESNLVEIYKRSQDILDAPTSTNISQALSQGWTDKPIAPTVIKLRAGIDGPSSRPNTYLEVLDVVGNIIATIQSGQYQIFTMPSATTSSIGLNFVNNNSDPYSGLTAFVQVIEGAELVSSSDWSKTSDDPLTFTSPSISPNSTLSSSLQVEYGYLQASSWPIWYCKGVKISDTEVAEWSTPISWSDRVVLAKVTEYYLSNSDEELVGGTWIATKPTIATLDQHLWERETTLYNIEPTVVSTVPQLSVAYQSSQIALTQSRENIAIGLGYESYEKMLEAGADANFGTIIDPATGLIRSRIIEAQAVVASGIAAQTIDADNATFNNLNVKGRITAESSSLDIKIYEDEETINPVQNSFGIFPFANRDVFLDKPSKQGLVVEFFNMTLTSVLNTGRIRLINGVKVFLAMGPDSSTHRTATSHIINGLNYSYLKLISTSDDWYVMDYKGEILFDDVTLP